MLQFALWRAEAAGRIRWPGGIPRRASGQPAHGIAGRRRAARRAALHPLRRMFERLPDLSQRRRAHLWDDVFGSHWLGHYTAFARFAGLETSLIRELALRRLHRDLPGENQSAPSFAPKPPQRGEGETGFR